jgi:hypothetical protein
LKYRLFRASNGATSFWRWEIHRPGQKSALQAGVLYGSAQDAKNMVEAAISRLSHKMARQTKTN